MLITLDYGDQLIVHTAEGKAVDVWGNGHVAVYNPLDKHDLGVHTHVNDIKATR